MVRPTDRPGKLEAGDDVLRALVEAPSTLGGYDREALVAFRSRLRAWLARCDAAIDSIDAGAETRRWREAADASAAPLMTAREFAALLAVPTKSAYAFGRRHGLAVVISEGRIRFDRAKAEAFLATRVNGRPTR